MSAIIIQHPFEDFSVCSVCLQVQLRAFRNEIKEQWNRYNNDGKTGYVNIQFQINPQYIWESPITTINGSEICLTHLFIAINKEIEAEIALREAANKPRLDVAPGSIDGFLKRQGN